MALNVQRLERSEVCESPTYIVRSDASDRIHVYVEWLTLSILEQVVDVELGGAQEDLAKACRGKW
jgi:hypothetical protein